MTPNLLLACYSSQDGSLLWPVPVTSLSLTSFPLDTGRPTAGESLQIITQEVAALPWQRLAWQIILDAVCFGSAYCCLAVLRGQRAAACDVVPAGKCTFERGDLLRDTRRLPPRTKTLQIDCDTPSQKLGIMWGLSAHSESS